MVSVSRSSSSPVRDGIKDIKGHLFYLVGYFDASYQTLDFPLGKKYISGFYVSKKSQLNKRTWERNQGEETMWLSKDLNNLLFRNLLKFIRVPQFLCCFSKLSQGLLYSSGVKH